jgi:hypothetical protein
MRPTGLFYYLPPILYYDLFWKPVKYLGLNFVWVKVSYSADTGQN